MAGFNVLHPMGWDAFGLPAEQYAIDTGTHPSDTTKRNINRFREQLKVHVLLPAPQVLCTEATARTVARIFVRLGSRACHLRLVVLSLDTGAAF
jgi:hypothetical protein